MVPMGPDGTDFQLIAEALLRAGLNPKYIHFTHTRIEKRAKDDRGRNVDGEDVTTSFHISPPREIIYREKVEVPAKGHVPASEVEKWKSEVEVWKSVVEKWRNLCALFGVFMLVAFLLGFSLGFHAFNH